MSYQEDEKALDRLLRVDFEAARSNRANRAKNTPAKQDWDEDEDEFLKVLKGLKELLIHLMIPLGIALIFVPIMCTCMKWGAGLYYELKGGDETGLGYQELDQWFSSIPPVNVFPPLPPHHHPPPHGHLPPRYPRFLNGKPAEEIFLRVPDNESAIRTSKHFAGKPHMAGTDGDYTTAIDFLHLLQKELGIHPSHDEPVFKAGTEESRNATLNIPQLTHPTAWVDTYFPVLNTPVNHSVEILGESEGDVIWTAQLEEVADSDLDPDAQKYAEAVPAFHGLSRGGEVQGKLVYAHYGRKEDYDALEEQGVNLNGTIVITRYNGIFRGLKVKGAQERGAVGCLVYSDIRDDGSVRYHNGYAAYPQGPARNPTSVQRGSVQFLSLYPGDPTTPGEPAYENSNRTDGENIPSIPSLPISWNTASRLLQEIEVDGKNRTIKLVNNVDTKVTPIWNTMAVIPGHIKNEVVMVGNHRDAWVLGATDPTSGTVSTYEVVRGLGVLLRKGWKPMRTILIASWDAEEYGLIGSTEWGEDFPEWIQDHVVAYLNLDSSTSGSRFGLSASPSLGHLVRGAAQDLPHPTDSNRTLWQARLDSGTLHGMVDEEAMRVWEQQHGNVFVEQADLAPSDDLMMKIKGASRAPKKLTSHGEVVEGSVSTGVKPVGSGSDYTVFLQRLGIAITNGGFSSTLSDPVYHYHSVFDSHPWQERYGDPGFVRHVAVAKHLGLQLLRLADSVILPLNTTQYALELHEYLDKVEDIAKETNLDTDFSKLRTSIWKLFGASEALDVEKVHAEKHLHKLIRKFFEHGHHRVPPTSPRHKFRCTSRLSASWKCRLSKCDIFEPVCFPHEYLSDAEPDLPEEDDGDFTGERLPRELYEEHPNPRKKWEKFLKQLKKAVERVQDANAKLVSFERGFISEEGLKDREWYRHLGVAPGKWLGYGATTLPGLTEALTIDKNATLAQEEAKRLKGLIDKLVKNLKA